REGRVPRRRAALPRRSRSAASSSSGLAGPVARPVVSGAVRVHRASGASSNSGAMAAGRSVRPSPSAGVCSVAFSNVPAWVTAQELGTSSAAVALGWLRARQGTVVPIVGARRVEHLNTNLAGIDVALSAVQLRRLDEVSAPTLDYPAPMHGAQRAMLQFAGTTVDGEPSTVYPPLVRSAVRY